MTMLAGIVLNVSTIVVRAVHDVIAPMEVIMVVISMEMLVIMLMVMNRQGHRRQRTLLLAPSSSSIALPLRHLLHLRRCCCCCCSGSIAGRVLTSWVTLVLAAVARFATMVPGVLLAPAPEVDEDGDDEGDEDEADGEAGGCGGGDFAAVRVTGVKHGGLVVVVEAGHVEDGKHDGRP